MSSSPEAVEVWRRYRDTRDKDLREQLIVGHMPLVHYVAARMLPRMHSSVEKDDLVSSGVFGLMDAVDRYDVDRGVKFSTFASLRIQGAMTDDLRAKAWGSRRQRARHRQVEAAEERLQQRLGRPATESELSEELELAAGDIRRAQTHFDASQVISLNAPIASGNGDTGGGQAMVEVGEAVAAQTVGDLPSHVESLGHRLASMIEGLPEKERALLCWIYVDGIPRKEIARMLGTGESWLSHLHTKAMVSLQRAMAGVAD